MVTDQRTFINEGIHVEQGNRGYRLGSGYISIGV